MTNDRPARLSAGECFDEALPLGAARPTPEPAPAHKDCNCVNCESGPFFGPHPWERAAPPDPLSVEALGRAIHAAKKVGGPWGPACARPSNQFVGGLPFIEVEYDDNSQGDYACECAAMASHLLSLLARASSRGATDEAAPARPTPSEQKAYEQGLDDGRLIEQAARRAAPADLPSVEALADILDAVEWHKWQSARAFLARLRGEQG